MPQFHVYSSLTFNSGTVAGPRALTQGQPFLLVNNETFSNGTASLEVALPNNPAGVEKALSLYLDFASDPSTFDVAVQTSDVNDDVHFITLAHITSGLNASFKTRLEFKTSSLYLRILKVSTANSVAMTAGVVRHY